jgi:hypothetical protein
VHHSFDTEHARLYGLTEAVLIYNFRFWIERNRANGENLREGRTWTYNSVRAFGDLFVYLSVKQIRRALDSLVAQGVLVTGNHNDTGRDRTLWYAFTDEAAFLDTQHHLPESANGPAQGGQSHSPKGANGNAQKGKSLIRADVNADGKPDRAAAGAAASRGARLPKEWVLPKRWGIWCKENADLPGDWTDEHIRLTATKFRNYWVAKSGRDAVKLDWFLTWQNWCLNPSSTPGKAAANSGPWNASDEAALAKAMEVGAGPARQGETKDQWHARIRACIDNGGKPPAPRAMPVTPLDPVPSPDEARTGPSETSRAAMAGVKDMLKKQSFGGAPA